MSRSLRSPGSFGVGEVLFSSEFILSPREVQAFECARIIEGRDDHPGFRPRFERPPTLLEVPQGLLVRRSIEAIEASGDLGGCRLRLTSVGRLHTLARIPIGAPLCAMATVRFRSEGPTSEGHRHGSKACFLTLAIEIRDRRGHKLGTFELGIELLAAKDQRPLAQALAFPGPTVDRAA